MIFIKFRKMPIWAMKYFFMYIVSKINSQWGLVEPFRNFVDLVEPLTNKTKYRYQMLCEHVKHCF